MSTKFDLKTAFPAHILIPPRLQALVDAVNADKIDPCNLSGSFELSLTPVGDIATWFAQLVTPAAKYAAEQLALFGHGPDGSKFALWKAPTGGFPVVYLGSEGNTCVLASDFDAFLRLLAICYAELGVGDWDEPPSEIDEDWEENIHPDFQQWVRAQGLDIPATGADLVAAAELAYPDFSGWCDEAVEGTLSAQTAQATPAPKPAPDAVNEVPADADLWTLIVAAIGQRIDSPVVTTLLVAVGAKPLKPGTPMNNTTYTTSKKFGLEISANCNPKNRAFWPMRKEGRVCVTYVTQIMLKAQYPGPLPHGLGWQSDEKDLLAIGTSLSAKNRCWDLPPPREGLGWFRAWTSEQGTLDTFELTLLEETDYITASASYEKEKPLVYVEDAFFTAWCAQNGLLLPEKFTPEIIAPLRERQITPLQFLHSSCERLLWSSDVKPEFEGFLEDYYSGIFMPDELRWVKDIRTAFGSSNHFRRDNEAQTADTWENYDRIAPLIARRFGEWRPPLAESPANKLIAIKLHQEEHKSSVSAAKQAVDDWIAENPQGRLRGFILMLKWD